MRDVQSFGGYVLHIGTLKSGSLSTGESMSCEVDYDRRSLVTNSHTLTHVINLALHQVLGDGVSQKGSLVDDTKARFDFSHGKAMTTKGCETVEKIVQEHVATALPVHIETVPLDKALEINNLRAVFGERYPDPVRVVSIGPTVPELLAEPESGEWEKYSIELCGGAHLARYREDGPVCARRGVGGRQGRPPRRRRDGCPRGGGRARRAPLSRSAWRLSRSAGPRQGGGRAC